MTANQIASTDIVVRRSDGDARCVTIRICKPEIRDDHASCRVEFQGLDRRDGDIQGDDTFQALSLAFCFVRSVLDAEESFGSVILLAEGEEPYDWRKCWFSEDRDA